MSGNPSHATIHWGAEISNHFEDYWKNDQAFSECKLDAYRQGIHHAFQYSWPTSRRSEGPLLEHDFSVGTTAAIENGLYPLFQPTNFVTQLSMDEVQDKLHPALQLASYFISDDHALEYGPGILIRRAGPITKDMLAIVKKELLELAGRVPISFASRIEADTDGHDSNAAACPYFHQVLGIIKASKTDISNSIMSNNNNRCMIIIINLKFFYQAMQHHHSQTTPAQKRCFQFFLALLLVHELTHVWIGICHPSTIRNGEAIVCSTDSFPECGFSWENFMFGARLQPSPHGLLAATTFQSHFNSPLHKLSTLIPVAWVNQWFLDVTWQNFAHLHSKGALLAPSTDRTVANFSTKRYCATARVVYIHRYINGTLDSPPCCKSELCGAHEPGITSRWPNDPGEVLALLLTLFDADIAIAKSHGKDIVNAIRNVSKGHYEDIVGRAESEGACKAKGAILHVIKALPASPISTKRRCGWLAARLWGIGKGVKRNHRGVLLSADALQCPDVTYQGFDVFEIDI